MQPFTTLTGPAAPLLRANIDTDVIIRIERLTDCKPEELGQYALEALRFTSNGAEDPEFVLNQDRFRTAPILIAGANFGCGSSREGAVVALMGRGVRCVIAPSFGGIFYANCFQNGLLPVTLPEPEVETLATGAQSGQPVTVDLERLTITPAGAPPITFTFDPRRRESLLAGLDEIGLTLRDRDAIAAWQDADRSARSWIWQLPAGTFQEA